MKTLIFALAAGLLAATASVASATPASQAAKAGAVSAERDAGVHTADYKDRRRMLHKRDGGWHRGHRHWNNDRYRAYRGWHRYSSRPYGWRGRGCVSVGPIWFCP